MDLNMLATLEFDDAPSVYDAVSGYLMVTAAILCPEGFQDEEEEEEEDEVHTGPPVDGRPGEHPWEDR